MATGGAEGDRQTATSAAVHRFEKPGIFDPEKDEWKLYCIRFRAALQVARVTSEVDKRSLLIASLDAAVFKRLYHLVQPRDITDVSFEDLVKALDETYAPKRFKEFERAKLFSSRQEENESVKDFLNRLRAIVATCEYETESDLRSCSLLTAFIVGLRDQRIRAKLVLEKTLTIEVALRLAESSLAAEAGSRHLDTSVVGKVSQAANATSKCFR